MELFVSNLQLLLLFKMGCFFGQRDPLWKYKRFTIIDKLHDDELLDPKAKMATVQMPKSSKQWSCWVYTYIDRANMLMISTEYKLELRVIREDAVMKRSIGNIKNHKV